MFTIRVQATMAACTCGWYVNTLTGVSAARAAYHHNVKAHSEQANVQDERLNP